MFRNVTYFFGLLLFLVNLGCDAPQEPDRPDDSVYSDDGKEKLVHGIIQVSADGKHIVHYGRGLVPGADKGPFPPSNGSGIVKVVNADLKPVYYWQNPRLVPDQTTFSSDGAFLAVGAYPMTGISDEAIKAGGPCLFFVVDLATNKKVFETVSGQGHSIAFSLNGKRLAVAWRNEGIHHRRLYEVPSMREVQKLTEEYSANKNRSWNGIKNWAFFDSDKKIIACSPHGLIQIIDAEKLTNIASMELFGADNFRRAIYGDITALPARGHLLIRGETASGIVFDPKKVAAVSTFKHHADNGHFVLIPQKNLLLCFGYGKEKTENRVTRTFKVWDLTKDKAIHEEKLVDEKQDIGYNFAIMPDGRRIVSVENGQLKMHDIKDLVPKAKGILFP